MSPTENSTETLERRIEDVFLDSENPILNETNSYSEFNPDSLPDKSPVELQVFTFKGVKYQVISHLDPRKTKDQYTYRELCDLREIGSGNIKSVMVGYSNPYTHESYLKDKDNWGILLLGEIDSSRRIAARTANKRNNVGIDEEKVDSLK